MTADSQPPLGGFLFLTTVGVLTALLHLSRMQQGEEDIESESPRWGPAGPRRAGGRAPRRCGPD